MSEITIEDVRDVVEELAKTNDATRENVESNLTDSYDVHPTIAERIIRDALMRGELYKPRNGKLARV